jgi:hypothetical protein
VIALRTTLTSLPELLVLQADQESLILNEGLCGCYRITRARSLSWHLPESRG